MADISEPHAVGPASGADRGGRRDEKSRRKPAPPQAPAPPTDGEVADKATVMGIPSAEMTPRVQAAFTRLLHEFDQQRAELEYLRVHETYLEAEVDKHAHLPVPNRRAFHREIVRVQSRTEQPDSVSSLAILVLRNFDDIRWREGRRAAEAALAYVAQDVAARIGAGEFLGSLGGNDLGLILTLCDAAEATGKLGEMVEALGGASFRWRERAIRLDVAFGVHAFRPGEDVGSILDSVDRALRRGPSNPSASSGA